VSFSSSIRNAMLIEDRPESAGRRLLVVARLRKLSPTVPEGPAPPL